MGNRFLAYMRRGSGYVLYYLLADVYGVLEIFVESLWTYEEGVSVRIILIYENVVYDSMRGLICVRRSYPGRNRVPFCGGLS
jgi:hypothetical protein